MTDHCWAIIQSACISSTSDGSFKYLKWRHLDLCQYLIPGTFLHELCNKKIECSNMSLCDLWLNHADSAYGSLIQDKQLWRSCCFSPTMKKGQKNSTPFLLFPRQTGLSHIFTGNRHTVTQSLVEKWKQWKRTPSLCSRLMNCGCFFSVGIPEL